MIQSKVLKMPPKQMLGVLFMQNGAVAISIALGGIIIFLILGLTISYKFIILSLVWLFFIAPMEIAFLYFYYGLRPLTTFNTIPHTISFSSDEVKFIFIPIDPEEKEREETEHQERQYLLKTEEFEKAKTGPGYILLFFGDKGWIWLPVEAFTSYDEFKQAISIFIPKRNESIDTPS